MSAKAMHLKAKINKLAKTSHIAAQVLLQNYMFGGYPVRPANDLDVMSA